MEYLHRPQPDFSQKQDIGISMFNVQKCNCGIFDLVLGSLDAAEEKKVCCDEGAFCSMCDFSWCNCNCYRF